MTVLQAQVCNSLWHYVFFLTSVLTSYGFQVIAGSENFTSDRDFSKSSCKSFAFGLGKIYILFKLITYLSFFLQIFGPDSPDSGKSSNNSLSSNSVTINTNPFLDDEPEISSDNITNNKPKPPPKKRNSDDSTTKLNDSRNVTPTKPLPLPTKAYRAPPPPSNKPSPAVRARVKAIVGSGKEG